MYQNAMIGWINHIRSGVLFAGSETTAQPVVNLQSNHGADAWQTAGTASSWLTVDAGSTILWRALVLARTNLTTAATVRWRIGPRESVVEETPSLLLDGPDTVPAGLTCTRTGTATRVNSAGQIEVVSANTLRWDYDPVTLELRGLLIEESRTNLFQRSAGIGTSPWGLTRAAVTASTFAAPDGTMTAVKLTADTTAQSSHSVAQTPVLADSTVYTWSVYGRAGEYSWIRLRFTDKAGAIRSVHFNVSTGTTGGVSGGVEAAYVEAVGNGWYRCSMAVSSATGASVPLFQIWLSDVDNGGVIDGDGVSGVHLWGAQCEAGSWPSSYIPTTSAAAMRSVDAVSIPNGWSHPWFNANEGALFAQYQIPVVFASSSPRIFNRTSGNNGLILWPSGTNGRTAFGPPHQSTIIFTEKNNLGFGYVAKVAASYSSTGLSISVDGLATKETAATITPTGTASNVEIGQAFTGHIRRLAYYPRRLANDQLRALTSSGSTITAAIYDSGTISAGVQVGYGQSVHVLPQMISGQYMRVDISDLSNPDGNLRIGLAYGGPVFQPAINISPSSALGREQGGTEVVTRGGQEYVTQDWQRRAWDIELEAMSDSEAMEGIYELDRIARAGCNVLLIPRPDGPHLARETVFGRLKETSSIGFHHQDALRRNWRGRITERL